MFGQFTQEVSRGAPSTEIIAVSDFDPSSRITGSVLRQDVPKESKATGGRVFVCLLENFPVSQSEKIMIRPSALLQSPGKMLRIAAGKKAWGVGQRALKGPAWTAGWVFFFKQRGGVLRLIKGHKPFGRSRFKCSVLDDVFSFQA